MRDQYGNTVPDDLVVICYQLWPADDEIEAIMDADWYEDNPTGLMLVPFSQLPQFLPESAYADPEDCGIETMDICYIADCLKRFNWKDGFYHA